MKVGIVNTGNVGLGLATPWIRLGYDVMLSKDTHPDQLQERVRKFGLDHGLNETELARFKYGSLADAAKFGDIVVMSIYFPRRAAIFEELHSSGATLAGKIVVDTINPITVNADFKPYHDLEYMAKTSTVEEIQREFPEAIVFKAFNNAHSSLFAVEKSTLSRAPTVIFVGGDPSSVDTARKLIDDAGFTPVFAGHELADARLLEKLGKLYQRVVENEYQGNPSVTFDVVQLEV